MSVVNNKIAIMQPYVFPYLGYFQLINAVDEFVFYDDVNFIKKGWVNRNRILLNGTHKTISFPCKKISQNRNINDVSIDLSSKEYGKLRKTIEYAYKKAPFYSEVTEVLNQIFNLNAKTISELAIQSVQICSNYMGVEKKYTLSSIDYFDTKKFNKVKRLIEISKKNDHKIYINPIGGQSLYSKDEFMKNGLELYFLNSDLQEYKQFNHPFVKGLSIIDVMMFNSPIDIKRMLNDYSLL